MIKKIYLFSILPVFSVNQNNCGEPIFSICNTNSVYFILQYKIHFHAASPLSSSFCWFYRNRKETFVLTADATNVSTPQKLCLCRIQVTS